MTVTNKYCVSGANWNLNFFYLAIQVGPPAEALGAWLMSTVPGLHYCYHSLQASRLDHNSCAFRFQEGKDM